MRAPRKAIDRVLIFVKVIPHQQGIACNWNRQLGYMIPGSFLRISGKDWVLRQRVGSSLRAEPTNRD